MSWPIIMLDPIPPSTNSVLPVSTSARTIVSTSFAARTSADAPSAPDRTRRDVRVDLGRVKVPPGERAGLVEPAKSLRSIMSDDDPVDLIKVGLAEYEWTLPFRSAGSRRSSRSGLN